MIVRCPECETAFSLPDTKMTSRGSKVRCSRCSHTFRVRLGDDGEPETFYKNEGVADPPTQELGDHLFDEAFTDDLDDAFEASKRPSEEAGEEPDSPFKSSGTTRDFIPFPFAGKAESEPESEADESPEEAAGIDLFEGEEAAPAESESIEDDPFEGAFESNETPGSEDILQPQSGPRAAPPQTFQPPPSAASAPVPKATPVTSELAEQSDHDIFSGQQGEFGPADELVDPEFGQNTAHFDPDSGPTEPAARPAQAKPSSDQPALTGSQPAPKPKPKPVAQTSTPIVEDWDVAPHTIGGGGFQKFANLVLIVLICAAGFIGVIVFQTGGFIDFARFDHMLSVAFEGENFEPRQAWIPPPPPPVAEVENFIEVENAFASLIPIGRGGSHVLIVNGVARNATDESIEQARLRVMILDDKGKILREETVVGGRTVAFEDIAGLSSTAAIDGLALSEAQAVPAKGRVEFMAIFKEVPTAILEHRKVDYRVEVVEPR